jgi:hypothetical protein
MAARRGTGLEPPPAASVVPAERNPVEEGQRMRHLLSERGAGSFRLVRHVGSARASGQQEPPMPPAPVPGDDPDAPVPVDDPPGPIPVPPSNEPPPMQVHG